jgi:hypothetical protein
MSRRRPTAAPAAPATVPERLLPLLDAQAGFDRLDTDGLPDQRPAALHALARLGADDARLHGWAREAARRLRPAPAAQAWPLGDPWYSRFGQPAAWPAYRDLFAQWLEHEGAGDMLQQLLPRLLPGCAGGSAHGLVRTAHAVAAAHRGELADALASWAAGWALLGQPAPGAAPTTDDPEAVLRRLRVVRRAGAAADERLQAAAAAPGFGALAASLRLHAGSVPQLAGLAAKAYAASGDAAVGQLIVSALALEDLLPFVDPDDGEALAAARAAWWRGFMATVSAAGLVALPPPVARPWPELVAAAQARDDAPAILLVDACVQWQARHADAGPWAAAATRALLPG